MTKDIKIILFFARSIIILIPVFLLSWLLYKDIVADGILTAKYDFKNQSPFISVLRPHDRVSEPQIKNGVAFQDVNNQPVYFDVRVPRHFKKAKVRLTYQNLDQPVFELGALADRDRWVFSLKPLDNSIMNFLLNDKFHWSYLNEGETFLFQKEKEFETIESFLNNMPKRETIAVYNYTIDAPFFLENYEPQDAGVSIHKTLRGDHRMFTYIKDENLKFTFGLQDVNRFPGEDHVTIEVYSYDSKIFSDFRKIDENNSDDWKFSDVEDVTIEIPDLPEGVYRLEIASPSDDIVVRTLATNQHLLTFLGGVYLGDNVGYSDSFDEERNAKTTLFTNGNVISAYTTHNEGIQKISVNQEFIEILETHKKFFSQSHFGIKEVTVSVNDVRINTKGLFSFSRESFLNPEFTSLADGKDFDREKIDYVIANYNVPKKENDWRETTVEFDVPTLDSENGELHFVLSTPFLKEGDAGVRMREIFVELQTKPLTINDFFKKIVSYVKR